MALHRVSDVRRLESAVKTLYEAYDQDDVPMEEFDVFVYKLVKPDGEDGKTTAELVRRSLCKYPDTLHLNLHETHFSFIQDVRIYCHSYRC